MAEVKLPIEEEELLELEAGEPKGEDLPDEDNKPEVPSELNILPLRDSVIYPMLIAPRAWRERPAFS